MGRLLLIAAIVAIADPFLLIPIYRAWGGWVTLGLIFIPNLIGQYLVLLARRTQNARGEAQVQSNLGDEILFVAARFLFLYPGPLSTLLALALLFQSVRRMLQRWAMRRIESAITSGNVQVFGGPGMNPNMPSAQPVNMDNLKRADGRTIEPTAELSAPEADVHKPNA